MVNKMYDKVLNRMDYIKNNILYLKQVIPVDGLIQGRERFFEIVGLEPLQHGVVKYINGEEHEHTHFFVLNDIEAVGDDKHLSILIFSDEIIKITSIVDGEIFVF
jgi:hypothetical protein